MAAAEYYSNAPMGPSQQPHPYQQPQYSQSAATFPRPQNPSSQFQQGSPPPPPPPPPYEAIPNDGRPTVHFADRPQRQQRPSFSSQAPIPVLAEQQHQYTNPTAGYGSQQAPSWHPVSSGSYPQPNRPTSHSVSQQQPVKPPLNYSPRQSDVKLQPPPNGYADSTHRRNSHGTQQRMPTNGILKYPQNPHYLSPYSQPNQSQYSINGYSSDPEHHRRRRRGSDDSRDKRRHRHDSRDDRRQRSRSSNADGLLGAAGGGLIGDLIFPGLGTIGGAVAGWIGGKDYGNHRKKQEHKLDRDQDRWEHKFGRTTGSHDYNHDARRKHDY